MTLGESRPRIDNTSSTKPKWKIIADGLKEAVGYMNPGRKLPNEQGFMDQYDCSRDTVRQALISLKDRGMIEIKRGRDGGPFVREHDLWNRTVPIRKNPESKAQKVAGTLLKRILEDEYPPGSRLPSEPELIAEFGFGRNTVRKALNLLEDMVYSKIGRGIFVYDQLPPQEKLDILAKDLRVSAEPEQKLLAPQEPQPPITVPREKHITRPQQIAGKLLKRIIAGDYGPGDKISTEQELMDESGFSRCAIGKGSKLLEGVIYLKPGIGKFVCNPLPPQEQLDMLAKNLRISAEPEQKLLAPQEPIKTILQETPENYYRQVARTLLERIIERDYGLGDKIPSLMELKAELGFGVVTIRQGIKLLADRGILDTKPGSGSYVNKDSSAQSELIQELGIIATTEELIDIIKSDDQMVAWRRVTKSAKRGLLEKMISPDELDKPILSLTRQDFRKNLACVGGKPMNGFYENARNDPKRKGKDIISFLIENSGIEITTTMVIEAIQEAPRFDWRRIPKPLKSDFFQYAAKERKKPIDQVTTPDLKKPFDFLKGKTLEKWLQYANRHKQPTQTRIAFLFEEAGIPHESGTRKTYRKDQMQKLFTEMIDGQTIPDHQVTDLLPWIVSVSKIYQRRDLNIEPHEIENELYLFVNGLFTDTTNSLSSEDMVTQAHQHIEKYISGQSTIGYKEKLLSTKIGDSDLTLGESLGNQEAPLLPAQTIFSSKTETALEKLSPLEKAVVIGITVDELTFDELANEINQNKEQFQLEADVDSDILQEYLEDALLSLRSEVDPNSQDDDLEE